MQQNPESVRSFEARTALQFLQTSLRPDTKGNLQTWSCEESHYVQVTPAILWKRQEFRSHLYNHD